MEYIELTNCQFIYVEPDFNKIQKTWQGELKKELDEIKENLRSWRRRNEIFEIFFGDVDLVFTRPFNSNTRNRRGTFEWACKSLVSFRRNRSSSDNHTGGRQISSVE